MKLSPRTVELLKNFATINQGMLFLPGNKISTISIMKNGFAQATIEEELPKRFAIYSLPELLGLLSMFNEPEIELEDKYLLIKAGKQTVKYFYAAENIIVSPPEGKEIKLPSEDTKLTLTASDVAQIQKAAAILKLDVIGISKDGIRAFTSQTAASTSNVITIETEVQTTAADEHRIKIENLKMIPGDYDVTISSAGIARLVNMADSSLVYHVPLEK